MFKETSQQKLIVIFLISSILIGLIFRFYNLNYDSLWFDEIVGFWVSDPEISIKESYIKHNQSEGGAFFFNFLLKITHKIFGYSPFAGRYLAAVLGSFSILFMGLLSKKIRNNNSFILTIFLVSFNVFLIKYSQEARFYSLTFLLSSLTILFLNNLLINNYNKKKLFLNSLYFILFQILAIISNMFAAIIFFSVLTFYIFYFYKNKKIFKNLNISIIFISIFFCFYLPFYIISAEISPSWMVQPSLKFFTNFYFSTFFGSRLLGIIHLFILIFLIINFRKKIINKFDIVLFLTILLILSYAVPLIFGFIFKPIIHSRYIIYVLIPIITLISFFIFEINNKYIKNFLIIFIILITIGNQFTEWNVKQFFQIRPKFKTDYIGAIKEIETSNKKNIFINHNFETDVFPDAIRNYIESFYNKKNKIVFLKKNQNIYEKNIKYLWIICAQDLGEYSPDCSKVNLKKKYNIIKNYSFISLNLKLIKFNP